MQLQCSARGLAQQDKGARCCAAQRTPRAMHGGLASARAAPLSQAARTSALVLRSRHASLSGLPAKPCEGRP